MLIDLAGSSQFVASLICLLVSIVNHLGDVILNVSQSHIMHGVCVMLVVTEAAASPTAATTTAELTRHGGHPDSEDSFECQSDGQQTFDGKSSISQAITVVVREIAVTVDGVC